MLSIAVILGLLAAVNCAPVNSTVQDINNLIDRTIVEVRKEVKLEIAGMPGIVLEGLQNLTRDGDCRKTSQEGVFECKAVSETSKITHAGEHQDVELHVRFQVTVDSEGHIVKNEVVETEVKIDEESNSSENNYYGWIKKHLHHLGHAISQTAKKVEGAVKEAAHVVIQQKATQIVGTIAASVIGG